MFTAPTTANASCTVFFASSAAYSTIPTALGSDPAGMVTLLGAFPPLMEKYPGGKLSVLNTRMAFAPALWAFWICGKMVGRPWDEVT